MIKLKSILAFVAASSLIVSCNDDDYGPFDWDKFHQEHPSTEEEDSLKTESPLADAAYKVMAHRGGSSESGTPDNSLAALEYAIKLGCAGSECDIYWTADDDVVVAHADGNCKINGLYPWEATLSELRAAGKLSNGETLPSLSDMLDFLMTNSKCTKLILDIKNITSPSTLTKYPINACRRACEIIQEKKAEGYVEFICTGNSTVMAQASVSAANAGIPIAWMANQAPSVYRAYGYSWSNLSTSYIYYEGTAAGQRTVEEFYNAGVDISVYNADTDEDMAYYISKYDMLKYICTNYPSKLIGKLKAK